ncbi:MAG: phosphodiester glycosidase family protein [Lachnospira sp.]|nr:phosphodiester glycosidase family protein [Lachnospira sp.]
MLFNRKKTGKGHLAWGIFYGIALTGFTVYTLLDAFVLPKNVVALENNNTERQTIEETGTIEGKQAVVTKNSYESEDIAINITTKYEYDTKIYIADVTVSDVSFLRAGLANGVFGRNIKETTSDIAKENNAIFAINGDFYGFRDSGPVIRNGVLYRSNKRSGSNDVLAVYNDGSFVTMKEENVDAQNLLDSGVLQLFSFGPTLVDNGQISVSANQEVEQSMNSNPRTAIGMISPLHYVFVVSDGRTSESAGLSLAQLAAVMQDVGCQCAYNLDGGGSSTMWFMGDVVNNPTTNGNSISERKVSDIVYIGQ